MKFIPTEMVLETDYSRIGIDSPLGDILYISHAHSDHIFGTVKREGVIASDATFELADIERTKKVNHKDIKLVNAGHILGSKQLIADTDEGRLVYTGDLTLNDGLIKGAQILDSDILMIESTYGDRTHKFPDQNEVWNDLTSWAKNNIKQKNTVLLGGYAIGKAQEIIHQLNKEGITPIVHDKIETYCKIYDKFGYKTDRINVLSDEGKELLHDEYIGIMPQNLLSQNICFELSQIYGRKVYCGAVTGQHLFRELNYDKIFPISDHASFDQLIEYVEHSNPDKVYCVHGHNKQLAKELNKIKYKATAIDRIKKYKRNKITVQPVPTTSLI